MRFALPVLALLLSACGSTSATDTIRVDASELAAIDLQSGATEHIVTAGPVRLRFILDVPADLDGDVPLVIAMPYAGDPVPTARQYHTGLARPGLAGLGAIIIVPMAFDGTWDTPAAIAAVSSFVEAATDAWPVDADRVVVTGYSNGGNGTWAQAARHAGLYSAAIPMGSYPPDNPSTALPLYVLHGENDELFPASRARSAAASVEARGGTVILEILPYSHFQAGLYAPALARAATSIQSDVWE